MQFQVPQNITMEDRIFGPLTTIQFAIVVIGGGVAFYLYSADGILQPPFNSILGGGMALFTLLMAVGKFNDQPLYKFSRHIFAFIFSPKTRVWHKKGVEVPIIKPAPLHNTDLHEHVVKNVSKGDIAKLAKVLDSRGSAGMAPIIKPVKGK